MASNPFATEEGLPEEDDYRPETLGQAALKAGAPQQQWPDYALELVPVLYRNGEIDADDPETDQWQDTGRRLVRRNGEFVSDVSDNYKLVPNERIVSAANNVARDLGAVPFHDFSGDWYVTLDDHVFQDPQRYRVHALYAWDDPIDVHPGGDEDPIQFGFAVHNSIDSSLGFQVGLFTFRHACANMVMMGVKGEGMGFDDREVIAHSTHSHTKGLDVSEDELTALIKNTLTHVEDVSDAYRAWHDQVVATDQVEELIDRLPQKDLPEWINAVREEFEEHRERVADDDDDATPLSPGGRTEIVKAHRPEAESTWDTYNQITESLWHDEETGDRSKRRKMKQLHRAIPPSENVR